MRKIHFYLTLIAGFVVCGGFKDQLYNRSVYNIIFLNISSCSTLPCEMIRGTNVLVQTIFDDNGSNTQFLKHSVRWIFNAVKTEATISPDPCNGQDECISNDSGGKSYWASVLVNKTLPVMRGHMLWEAGDENNRNLICFKVPVTIMLGY